MSIKAKIQIFLGFVMLSALLLLDVLFTNFLITSAGEADRERLTRELSRTVMSVKGEERMLTAIAGNWAYSDNTWDFMNGKYPEYPKAYLNRDVLTEIGISSMIYLDKDSASYSSATSARPTTPRRRRANSTRYSARRRASGYSKICPRTASAESS